MWSDNLVPPTHAEMRCPKGREIALRSVKQHLRMLPLKPAIVPPARGRVGVVCLAACGSPLPRAESAARRGRRTGQRVGASSSVSRVALQWLGLVVSPSFATRMEDLAMATHCAELSPDDPQNIEARRQQIIDFWNELRTYGDPGATTWEVLEPLERQVTEYLDDAPSDLRGAESTTAHAALLIAGCHNA